MIDLKMGVDAVVRELVDAYAFAGVTDKGINSRKGLELFGDRQGLPKVFEVALLPFDFAAVAEFLELCDS